MTDNKKSQYIVQIGEEAQLWDADKLTKNSEKLASSYPDAQVYQLDDYDSAEAPSEGFSYIVTIGNESQQWDAAKLTKNQERLFAKYPDAKIQKVSAWANPYVKTETQIAKENLDAFRAENGAFLDDFEARDTAERKQATAASMRGVAVPAEDGITGEEREMYYGLHKQEEELKRAYYNSPDVVNARLERGQNISEMQREVNSALAQMENDSPEAFRELKQSSIKRANPRTSLMAAKPLSADAQDVRDDCTNYQTALNLLDDAVRMNNAPGKYDDSNGFVNFLKGMGDTFSDADFWTAGLTEIADNMNLRSVFAKVQDKLGSLDDLSEEAVDGVLTDSEKKILAAFVINTEAQYDRAEDLSRAVQAGQSAAESLGFMAEFILTGGVASGARAGVKAGVKKVLGDYLGRLAGKVSKTAVGKYGKRLAGDIIEAAARTGVMPSTYRNMSQKAVEINEDPETGERKLASIGEAVAMGFADSFIESLAEGGRVGALGNFMGDVLGAVKPARALMEKVRKSDIAQLVKMIGNTEALSMLRAGGWHGIGEEYLEEWYGAALRTLTNIEPDALKDFATVDSQIITLTSFIPMTLIGGTVTTGKVLMSRKELEQKAAVLKSAMIERGYSEDHANLLVDNLRTAPMRNISDTFTPMVNKMALQENGNAPGLMKAVADFAEASAKMQSYGFVYEEQEAQQRRFLLNEMEERIGRFWQEDAEGNRTVDLSTMEDGTPVYILNREEQQNGVTMEGEIVPMGPEAMAVDMDGNVRFVNAVGESETMSLDDYLNTRLIERRGAEEEARMAEEAERYTNDIKSQIVLNQTILNMGTQENPIDGLVVGMTANGVMVQTQEGMTPLTWEEVGNKLSMPNPVRTDAQIDEAEAANLEAQKAAREAMLDEQFDNPAAVEEDIAAGEVAEEVAEGAVYNYPRKSDGSVDGNALWNENVREWVKWNNQRIAEKYGVTDNGADSVNYLQNQIASLEKSAKQIANNKNKETDLDKRMRLEDDEIAVNKRLAELRDVLAELTGETAVEEAEATSEEESIEPAPEAPAVAEVEADESESSEPSARQTVIDLYSDSELTEDEVEDYIKASLKKAQTDLDKHLSKAPKMGTDIAKYKADKARHAQKTAELEKRRDFWKEVQSYVEIPQTQLDMEPQNALEFTARELSVKDGIKLLYDSVKRHTGWGSEMGGFISILRTKEKGGMTLEEAGERLMELDRENSTGFFDQNDPNAGLNAILEVLGGARTAGDISVYIKANREQTAKEEVAAARNAMMEEVAVEAQEFEQGGLTAEEAVLKEGKEVSISSHEVKDKDIKKEMQNGKILHLNSKLSLNSDGSLTEAPVEERPDLVPTSDNVSSEDKDSNIVESAIESEEKVEDVGDIPDEIWYSFRTSAAAYFRTEDINRRFFDMKGRINGWSRRLGVKVSVAETLDDVTNRQARAQILKGGGVFGFFDPATGEVVIYLPDFLGFSEEEALSEIDKTFIHEVVSHKGLRGLLGEEKYGELCDMVWDAMTAKQQRKYLNYPGVNGDKRAAADEFIAHFAENVDYADNRTMWDKIVDFIKDLFKSVELPVEISYEGMADLLRQSYRRLAKSAKAARDNRQAAGNVSFRTEAGSLIGMHNISEDKLRKVIKLGGSANPSTAVIDVEGPALNSYGEISLIMPSSLVDAETGRNAGTFTADAWTPTYPQVSKRFSDDKLQRAYWRDVSAIPEEMQSEVRMAFNSWLEDRNADGLSYMFLHERGEAPEIVRVEAKFPQEIKDKVSAILGDGRSGLYELSDEEKQSVLELYIQENFGGSREDFDKSIAEQIQRIEDRLSTGKVPSFVEKRITMDLQWMKEHGYNYDNLSSFVNSIVSDIRHAGEANDAATTNKARDYIKDNGLEGEYERWKESLNERYGIKEYLFGGYTPSGNPRWLPNTVENASRLMNKEGLAGATGLSVSFNRFVATLAPKKKSLSDIRKSNSRLVENYKLVDDFTEKWSEVFFDLGMKCQPDAKVYEDYGLARLTEAAQKKNPGAYLKKEYGVELSQEDLRKLDEMIKAIKTEFPTRYFETKFQRPVYMNEFAAAVMPTTTSEDVKQAVADAGLPIFEYDSSVEGSRREATLKATEGEGIRFRFIGEKGAANLDAFEEATTRLDNLAVARQMEEAGKDAKSIKLATGWERGADNLWRYEEQDFWIEPEATYWLAEPTERKPLSEYVDKYGWEYFVQAYPQLKDLDIEIKEYEGYGGGYYDSDENLIVLRPSNGYEFNEAAIMHEVQHAIQRQEGLATGSNPEMFIEDEWLYGLNQDTLLHALRIREQAEAYVAEGRYKRMGNAINLAAKIYDSRAEESVDKEESIEVAKYRDSNELYRFIVSGRKDAERKYFRTAGEVEARNVVERYKRGWENGEYRYHLASETEDVAREDQIILMDGLGVSEMGSRVDKRMLDIEKELSGTTMNEAQETVYNVFVGKQDKQPITVQRKDGVPTVIVEQGAENKSGAKHAIYKHYGTGSGFFTAKDVLLIPEIVNNGTRKQDGNKVVYELTMDGVRYRVVTYVKTGNEIFNNFYTNRKNQPSQQVNAQKSDTQSALASEELASADKDTNKSGNGNTRFRITPEQDNAYMDAVEAGDMETAQRMVNEAARLAGYDSSSDYQGSLAFNGAAPSGYAYYDTKEERIEAWESRVYEDDQTLGDYKDAGVDISNLGWYLTSPTAKRVGKEYTREAIKNLADAVNSDSRKIKVYRAVDADIKENTIRNGDWVTPSRAYAEYHIGLQDWKSGRIIEQEVDIDDIWWDGNDINEWGYNDGNGYAYKNTPNNRKLLAPVTYDDAGNVIPLSERFNEQKEDIRFRLADSDRVQGMDMNVGEIKDAVRGHIADVFYEEDFSVEDIEVIGSRTRNEAREDSDLDVLVQYSGDYSEDGAFNALNDEPLVLDGITVDINPIRSDKSGTIEEWVRRNDGFTKRNEDVRFRASNENQAIFVSNAAKAVEGIKQEKATPEQWLKMIEKNGGLKAGEDKWMGLSDWLKASDKKTLTKQEVLDFINENMIVIEEQHYAEGAEDELYDKQVETISALQERFDEYVAESEDMNDDMFMDTHYSYAINRLVEDLGYTPWGAPFVNHNGSVELVSDDIKEDLPELRNRLGLGGVEDVRDINYTRLQYTTEGLENKREIALVVPAIEPWNERDDIHFGDAGEGRAVAWIRFGDAIIPMDRAKADAAYTPLISYIRKLNDRYGAYQSDRWTDEERKEVDRLSQQFDEAKKQPKVLVIDEIQSKRHQEGREKGYRVNDINQWLKDNNVEVVESGEFYEFIKDGQTDRRFSKGLMNYDVEKAKRLYVSGYNKSDIPDAPFEKNWHELAMKRMLRYAAENGYDVIAWTKGEQQAERYSLAQYFNEVSRFDLPGIKERRFELYGSQKHSFHVNEEGQIVESTIDEAIGKPLADVVGKELAVKMMSMENPSVLNGEEIAIGGEGMKGFYDKILPSFMNKYGKKWGIKVEDIKLNGLEDGSLTMHSVPVTEEMKSSVMEGQVMFRAREEDETAEGFMASEVNAYESRYKKVAPVELVDFSSKQAVGALLGVPAEEVTDEDMEYIAGDVKRKNIWGGYNPDTKKIHIFVRDDIKDGRMLELVLFHENIHALNDKDSDFLALGRHLFQVAKDGSKEAKYRNAIVQREKREKWFDEMSGYVISEHMQNGTIYKLESMLNPDNKKRLNELLEQLGYDKETESEERGTSSSLLRNVDDERVEGAASQQKEAGADLTAEERRIINGYFPGAFAEETETDEEGSSEDGIRYRAVTDEETLDRLNSEPTIKVYRAMQVIDGKLYPPMSAKVDGKLREPVELGQWEEAEERPDLADDKGRFKLDKGNKTSVPARYNPYFHTSRTPLNDQFSSAQSRPNLVTVEVEVPESELTSGYKAEKAKDSVGEKEWKAGVVQGKLSGTRKVILSRWDKPVRIVPDGEVADMIVEMLEGKDITMPTNVVTPSLRAELEKRGVPFVETDNQGRPVEDDEVRFRSLDALPAEEVVEEGLDLTDRQVAELAGNLFEAFPYDIRKKITDGLDGNILGLKDAILQIPASLAAKEEWNDEDREIAGVIAREVQSMIDIPMKRSLSASEALWMLYDATHRNPSDIVEAAQKAFVKDRLGFSDRRLEEKQEMLRFRAATQAEIDAMERNMTAADLYNRDVTSAIMRLRESFQDMYRSVQKMVDAIVRKSGKAVESFEDIMLALNQLSSKNLADKGNFLRKFLMPMWDAVLAFKENGHTIEDVTRYVMLKHGLERNDVLAQRDARNYYKDAYDKKVRDIEADKSLSDAEKQDKKDKAKDDFDFHVASIQAGTDAKYRELRERDYGAVMALYSDYVDIPDRMPGETVEQFNQRQRMARRPKYTDLAAAEAEAAREVAAFENANRALCDRLWKRINAATKETLKHQYEHNVISRQTYDHVRGMFEFYIPLRGFKEDTAEDIYSYYGKDISTDFANPLIRTKGRTTLAESPFGWIGSMAESAVQMDNKNDAKMRLYYFAVNRPGQNLLTIQKTWYRKTGTDADGKSIWEPSYPNITSGMDHDQTRQEIERHDAEMKALAASGLATQKKSELGLRDSVVNIGDRAKPEHAISVVINGEEQVMYVNGNPRAAQAINGMLNIDRGDSGVYRVLGQKITRWMSQMNTSYNPAFWISNYERDLLFTLMNVNVKEDKDYQRSFWRKNYVNPGKMMQLLRKYENGMLDESVPLEKMYKEFADNGGVTGYTVLANNEEYDRLLEKYSRDAQRSGFIKWAKNVFGAIQDFGEGVEQASRFAAYVTSRQMGRPVEHAIGNAKDVTVNFNRKGSGKAISWDETAGLSYGRYVDSHPKLRWCARVMTMLVSGLAPAGRSVYMFFNASIQGLKAFGSLMKRNPGKMAMWSGAYFGMGFALVALNHMINAMLGGDDDDYLDIPDWERRNNILVGGNGFYLKWALPQEARPFYAIADIIYNKMAGRSPDENLVEEVARALLEVMPVNPMGEGGLVQAVVPSALSPIYEVWQNTDYKGMPLYRESYWSTGSEPKYDKAFSGTGKVFVEISRLLNDVTGGDYAEAGWANIHPATIEHIIEGYGGGTVTFFNQLMKTLTGNYFEGEWSVRNTPFLNRLVTINDERYRNSHTSDLFRYYENLAKDTKRIRNVYKANGDVDKLDELMDEERYEIMRIYERYRKREEKYDELIRDAEDDGEKRELMAEQDEMRREMIKEISEL